jgi:hypothetical protein
VTTKILGISGRQSSGKDALNNYIHTIFLNGMVIKEDETSEEVPFIDSPARLDGEGRIIVKTEEGDEGILSLTNPGVSEWLDEKGFGLLLKRFEVAACAKVFARDYFGLDWSLLNGSHEDKNTETPFAWSGVVKPGAKRPGNMTYRDFLEYFHDVFCGIDEEAPIKLCLKEIEYCDAERSVIVGVRKPADVDGIQGVGGKVIRLLRDPYHSNTKSDSALDNYSCFDAVIDNRELTMEETHRQAERLLVEWGFLPA